MKRAQASQKKELSKEEKQLEIRKRIYAAVKPMEMERRARAAAEHKERHKKELEERFNQLAKYKEERIKKAK